MANSKAFPSSRRARSGEKYRTPQGFTAIKDGIKASARTPRRCGRRQAALAGAPLAAGVAIRCRTTDRA